MNQIKWLAFVACPTFLQVGPIIDLRDPGVSAQSPLDMLFQPDI
jgi:hypothetical protein